MPTNFLTLRPRRLHPTLDAREFYEIRDQILTLTECLETLLKPIPVKAKKKSFELQFRAYILLPHRGSPPAFNSRTTGYTLTALRTNHFVGLKMQKILIIGCAGAGKTVLATELGALTNLPVIHLDAHYWKPGWIRPQKEDWIKAVADLVKPDRWIIDGNYGSSIPQRLSACDSVIFLAYSRWLCLFRVFRRSLSFWGRTRPDLNPGCAEKLPDREFLTWIWNYQTRSMPSILETLRSLEGEKEILILRSPAETRKFLNQVREMKDVGKEI